MEEIPNDGIIRYLDIFNIERLAVVSPAALAEVLVHRCYDFEKPSQIRKGISRILGMGLFLAEGNVHKVGGVECDDCVADGDVASTQRSHASILIPPYQRFVSCFLEQISRNGSSYVG